MKSWIRKAMLAAAFAVPASAPTSVLAQDPQEHVPLVEAPLAGVPLVESGIMIEEPLPGFTLTPAGERFSVRGWFNGGYVYNTGNPASGFNGPYNSVDLANQGMFNQAYIIGEYLLPKDGSFGWGTRVDAIYGEDYLLGQSAGFELNPNGTRRWNGNQYYGFALPQIYGQVGTNDTNVKVGRFYSIVGYEGVMAVDNFFYSKSYSYQFAGPFTHWGALASHNLTDNLTIQGGVHLGWNVLDTVEDHVSFIGGVKYKGEAWWTSFAVTTGEDPQNLARLPGVATGFTNRTRYSFIVDGNLTDNLEYVFHHWFGIQEDGAPGNANALWYGIDQYAYYKINNCWKLGGRFEWFNDQNGTRVGLNRPANPNVPPLAGDYFSASVGLNYSPITNLIIRPELRYDWVTDNTRRAFDDGTQTNQFMLGIDVILRY